MSETASADRRNDKEFVPSTQGRSPETRASRERDLTGRGSVGTVYKRTQEVR